MAETMAPIGVFLGHDNRVHVCQVCEKWKDLCTDGLTFNTITEADKWIASALRMIREMQADTEVSSIKKGHGMGVMSSQGSAGAKGRLTLVCGSLGKLPERRR